MPTQRADAQAQAIEHYLAAIRLMPKVKKLAEWLEGNANWTGQRLVLLRRLSPNTAPFGEDTRPSKDNAPLRYIRPNLEEIIPKRH